MAEPTAATNAALDRLLDDFLKDAPVFIPQRAYFTRFDGETITWSEMQIADMWIDPRAPD